MILTACTRQRAQNVWVTVGSESIEKHQHRVTLTIEDDGEPLTADQLSLLGLDGVSPTQSLPLSADIHLILVGRWLRELGVSPDCAVSQKGGMALTFKFTAEVFARAAMAAQNMDINAAPRAASVLVVDDDASVRQSIQQLVKNQLGVNVTLASSGMEALRLLDNQSVDLVITDYFMPGMDGAEMIRSLREAGNDTPVLAITTAGIGDDQDKLWLAGADVVLPKPFTPTSLTHLIQRYLHA